MTNETGDEYTPHGRGLLIGYGWARDASAGRVKVLGPDGATDVHVHDVLEAAAQDVPHVAERLAESIMDLGKLREILDEDDDEDTDGLFWAGFRDGVRVFLVEQRIWTGTN